MTMKNAILLLCFFILPSTALSRTAAFDDSTARKLISSALKMTFMLDYDSAFIAIDSLEVRLSDHAIVPLLRAGIIYCRMLDHEDELEMEDFERYYDKAWSAGEKLVEDGEIAEGNLYLGIALGFRGLIYQRLGQWWPAVREGLKAVKRLRKCLKTDSTYYDAYLGVGTYKYWSSKATDFINWLPLIPDQKEEGIALMRVTMEKGLFGREIARSTLAWTLIDYGRPLEAVRLSREGLKKYPNSRYFLWTLANGYYKMGRLRKAIEVYQQLFDSIHSLKRNNYYNEIGIAKRMAVIYLALDQPHEALTWIQYGLNLKLNDRVKERRKKTLKQLSELKIVAEKKSAKKIQ
jgi:tetratricopeptide (TPR) repeat protein